MAVIRVAADYGYVILCLVLSWVMVQWLSLQVVKARKKFSVEVSDIGVKYCVSPVRTDTQTSRKQSKQVDLVPSKKNMQLRT